MQDNPVFFTPTATLKRRGRNPDDEQAVIAEHMIRAGHGYLWTASFDEAVETLKAWGVLRSGIRVQRRRAAPVSYFEEPHRSRMILPRASNSSLAPTMPSRERYEMIAPLSVG